MLKILRSFRPRLCALCRLPLGSVEREVQRCTCGLRSHTACVEEFEVRACPTPGCRPPRPPLRREHPELYVRCTRTPPPARPWGVGLLSPLRLLTGLAPTLATLWLGAWAAGFEVEYALWFRGELGVFPDPHAFGTQILGATFGSMVGWLTLWLRSCQHRLEVSAWVRELLCAPAVNLLALVLGLGGVLYVVGVLGQIGVL